MERLKITPGQAFAVLTRLSQERNEKLREVARRLVETGEIPGREQR
jgi:AmiR/NasT family two-component response regulator